MKKKSQSKRLLDSIRNIGVIAHIDAGKTTLTERMLFYSGIIHRLGEVHDGAATMDYMPEEQERGITIISAMETCRWKDKVINIIDTPGHVDFTIEVERSMRVLDGAVGVFSAVDGVEPQSETVWRQSEKYGAPKLAFINKMDRPGADFEGALTSMIEKLAANPAPMQTPLFDEDDFVGLIDLATLKKLTFDPDDRGRTVIVDELTEAEAESAVPWRERLLETLAEADEEFFELYVAGEGIEPQALTAAARRATLSGKVTPVFAGSALRNIGVQPLMDAVCDLLPSPAEAPPQKGRLPESGKLVEVVADPDGPLVAYTFKVSMVEGRKAALIRVYAGRLEAGREALNVGRGEMEKPARLFRLHADHRERIDSAVAGEIVAAAGMKYAVTGDTLTDAEHPVLLESIGASAPVISMALEPTDSEEAERLDQALQKMLLEDPTLAADRDEETDQLLLSGMGELHLEVALERLRREYGLHPRAGRPQVVYRETIAGEAEAAEEFDRLLGDVRHYGWVRLSVSPREREQGADVRFEVNAEEWPQDVMDAVAEGVEAVLSSGPLKGYPVQDVHVRVLELRRKQGVEKPAGYHVAAAGALRSALQQAEPTLLQPIMWLEISAPDDYVGEVVSLLGMNEAKVENMLDRAGAKVVQALAPLKSLFGFSTKLRSATKGRAGMTMRFARFDALH